MVGRMRARADEGAARSAGHCLQTGGDEMATPRDLIVCMPSCIDSLCVFCSPQRFREGQGWELPEGGMGGAEVVLASISFPSPTA